MWVLNLIQILQKHYYVSSYIKRVFRVSFLHPDTVEFIFVFLTAIKIILYYRIYVLYLKMIVLLFWGNDLTVLTLGGMNCTYFFSLSYLQCKHPQTVVILLGYRDYSDLDALMGHSVLRPVFSTFLQHTMDIDSLTNPCIYLLKHPSPSFSSLSCKWTMDTDLVFLFQVGDHHYDWTPLLPHHPPEVPYCVHGGTLGSNVCPLFTTITLETHTQTWRVLLYTNRSWKSPRYRQTKAPFGHLTSLC